MKYRMLKVGEKVQKGDQIEGYRSGKWQACVESIGAVFEKRTYAFRFRRPLPSRPKKAVWVVGMKCGMIEEARVMAEALQKRGFHAAKIWRIK